MRDVNLHQEGLDFEAIVELDAFDRPVNHRAWIVSGDVVANASVEDYERFQEWMRELGGQVTAISRLGEVEYTPDDWEGIDIVPESDVVLLSRPVFDTAGKRIKAPRSSVSLAFNHTAFPSRASINTDKAKYLSPEVLATEREGWISALAPVPGRIDFEVLKYASESGLLTARLENFGRASQRVVDEVIRYTGEIIANAETGVE